MTLAKTNHTHTPWFAKAGAACSIIPISRFVGPSFFALKGGGYGCLFSLDGIDEEGLTDQELNSRVAGIEGSLRGLSEGSCLYQYTRVMSGFDLPRQKKYQHPVTESFVNDRLTFLDETARFRRIDLHWCLTFEPTKANPFERKPAESIGDSSRMLADLRKAATILQSHLSGPLGLKLLGKNDVFRFFSYLYNLEQWAEHDHLQADTGVDRQIVKSAVSWGSDHLRVGKRHVQMFSLTNTPEASRPCLFSGLMTLDCDSILCSSWRPKSAASARKEIESQEKFIDFFKVGVFTRAMSGRDHSGSLNNTAGAKAANNSVEDLSEVIRSLDKKGQGEYSLRLLLAAKDADQLRDSIPAVHRVFVDARAQVMEETLGNLSGFYAMFPGNHKFNVFPLWLSEDHHARLSCVFAPHIGHPASEDLDAEYLNVFETRTGTPYFQDAYVNGVRVMLVIGPTGTGKSVHENLAIAHEQKYGGFTYIFDIGGSYESVVELYGGRVDKVGKDGPRVNPFALEPTESNIKFLYSFVKLLLTNGGAELEPEDDDVIHKAVQGVYLLDRTNRRLSNLFLPKHLQRYLVKWVDKGIYSAVFDNIEDSLSLSRLQCFDFAGVSKQYADLIEPLMVWLLRRIDDVVYDPANLGVPKHVVIEEIFSNMKNKQLLEGALASIKTVRKNLGGVTLIGQSANDLGDNADSIVNSCTSFLFLPDATFNRKHYGELFKLTEQQLNLFESLGMREGLYVRRDGFTKVITLNLDQRSYAKFSTKPKDRVRRSKLVEKYGLTEGIERFAEGEVA
jgi:type IV secretion system protein VirB4